MSANQDDILIKILDILKHIIQILTAAHADFDVLPYYLGIYEQPSSYMPVCSLYVTCLQDYMMGCRIISKMY